MSNEKDILNQKWFYWGKDFSHNILFIAGSPDPNLGIIFLETNIKDSSAEGVVKAQKVAQHIVDLHNVNLNTDIISTGLVNHQLIGANVFWENEWYLVTGAAKEEEEDGFKFRLLRNKNEIWTELRPYLPYIFFQTYRSNKALETRNKTDETRKRRS